MAKIYMDTNHFLDFYRFPLDNFDVFDELQKCKNSLVLTEQTITEFRRNRAQTLNQLVTNFEKTINNCGSYITTVLRLLPEHKELTELLAPYRKKGREVLEYLKELVADVEKDPIAQKFLAFAADAAVTNLKLTDPAIDKAHRRKLLGNPPCSRDKYSVGDEVIWELLLEHLREDLIVVTRDDTFHENFLFLREEYQQHTGRKLLLVTTKFSEALKAIGQLPAQELIEAEKKEEQRPAPVMSPCNCPEGPCPSGWKPDGRFLMVRCLKCGRVLAAQENPDIDC